MPQLHYPQKRDILHIVFKILGQLQTRLFLKLFSMPAGLRMNGACVYACFSIITMATVSHFFSKDMSKWPVVGLKER